MFSNTEVEDARCICAQCLNRLKNIKEDEYDELESVCSSVPEEDPDFMFEEQPNIYMAGDEYGDDLSSDEEPDSDLSDDGLDNFPTSDYGSDDNIEDHDSTSDEEDLIANRGMIVRMIRRYNRRMGLPYREEESGYDESDDDRGIPPYAAPEDDWIELDSISDTDLFALQSLYNALDSTTLSASTEFYYEGIEDLSESVFYGWDENSTPNDTLDDIIDYDLSSDYRSDTESENVTSDEDMLSSGSAEGDAPLTVDNPTSAGSTEPCMKCPEVLYVMNRSGRLYITEDMGTLREIISTLDDEESDDIDYYQEDGPNNCRRQCVTINVLRLSETFRNISDLDENNNVDENHDCPKVLYLFCWSGHVYITGNLPALRELIGSLDEDEADYEYTDHNQSYSEMIDEEEIEVSTSRRRRCVTISVLRA